MASYHLTVKNHSRSKNANAVALASYRSGEKLFDERTQMLKDCRKDDKSEILHSELFNSHRMNREQLWNVAERAENRKNSVVAREVEIALPVDISNVQKVSLARDFCKDLARRYNCAIDLAVHAPDVDGDQRNYHAHILMTTREVGVGGMGAKWRQLNQPNGAGRIEMAELRKKFELLQNGYLEKAGLQERVTCGRVSEMDLPKKYVALPFKKYQVMRREERVEEYKQVSGEEEFSRWKAKKDLEIEDLAGQIESLKREESLELEADQEYCYDPVQECLDRDIQRKQESKKQSIEERGRRRNRRQKRRQERQRVQQSLQKERQERLSFREESKQQKQKEGLEKAMDASAYYDPVGALIDDDIQRYEQRQERELEQRRQELEEHGRRAIGEFKGLARVNKPENGQAGREDKGTRPDDRQRGVRATEACGNIEQGALEVRRFREQRVITARAMRYCRELAKGFQGYGQTARGITAGIRKRAFKRRVDKFVDVVKGAFKAVADKIGSVVASGWFKMNVIPDTGRPWWEDASKIEHEEKFKGIQEKIKTWQGYDYIKEKGYGAENTLDNFNQHRDHITTQLDTLEKEAKKWNKKDPLLEKIYEMKITVEERSKEVVPELNKKVQEEKQEMEKIQRRIELAKAQQARRDLEEMVRKNQEERKKKISFRPTYTEKKDKGQDRGGGISM